MQIPMDAVVEGMGFDELGRWHKGTFLDFWRWSFSDLRDERTRNTIVELIAKMELGEPGTMTAEEFELFWMTTAAGAREQSGPDRLWGFDA